MEKAALRENTLTNQNIGACLVSFHVLIYYSTYVLAMNDYQLAQLSVKLSSVFSVTF